MKLYITRHGETDANIEGILQGWLDTELNENGIAQAAEAASYFNKPIDAIFSSDLKRATRTAQEFRDHYKGVPYFEDVRLRLRDFGDATGTHRDNHDLGQFWSVEDRSTIPNAEALMTLRLAYRIFLMILKLSLTDRC
jgi:broad specificity phosphatase PhoE